MTGYGAFDVTAGALQIFVPSYGWKLVRRFGTRRVGWFMVTSFISMAALHLLEPLKPTGPGVGPEIMLNLVYVVGSVLLLVGMGHIHTLFSQHERSQSNEESLSTHWEAQVRKETQSLARANEALTLEIARRKEAEAVLRESEAQYRFLFTENPQPMWVLDLRECRFLAVNKAALKKYGFTPEEFMRLTPQDLLPREQVEAFLKDISKSCTRVESRQRWQHYRKDQTLVDVEVAARDFSYAGSPARLVVVYDISEQERREYEAYQSHKMGLAAQISGGVANQLNDVLTVIENRAALLRQKTRDNASIDLLQEVSVATTRGSNLAYQMLAASGQQVMQPKPLDLNRLIVNMNLIIKRLVGDRVVFQNLCGPNVLPVMADPQIIEQVMITLVKNAREAIADRGQITASTAVVRIEEPPVSREGDERSTDFVRLIVRDTGCGMSPEDQAHLFEPFFTTKEAGMGLGLAGVYGAVRQHWGWVECVSEVEAGTEFRVFLPCISEALLPSATEMQAATALDKGTILLVDPNDRTRAVARYVLNRHGYRVIEADSGGIALTLWESQARNVDLLLTDLALPGASGFDLANQLRQTRPSLKAIYTCANAKEAKSQAATLPDDYQFIAKPYHADKLLERVEACLSKGNRE